MSYMIKAMELPEEFITGTSGASPSLLVNAVNLRNLVCFHIWHNFQVDSIEILWDRIFTLVEVQGLTNLKSIDLSILLRGIDKL